MNEDAESIRGIKTTYVINGWDDIHIKMSFNKTLYIGECILGLNQSLFIHFDKMVDENGVSWKALSSAHIKLDDAGMKDIKLPNNLTVYERRFV